MNGKIIHRCGIKVLDGTENWNKHANFANVYNSTTVITNRDINKRASLSTHFIYTNTSSDLNTVGYMFLGVSTQTINFAAPEDVTTITEWKQWLADQYAAGTPVIVVYPLETPATETVTAQSLTIQAGTNVITAEGSIDNLPLEVSYKAGVSVTITEVQNAQLDNNVEVTING